ncbi:MAG: efflux RND transporter periplasmic adaptor subunit [Pirellulaceae bacterium]|nr:efflux RND transporter periplasmic adaptor subunit [Pirellulaceae bacterium]
MAKKNLQSFFQSDFGRYATSVLILGGSIGVCLGLWFLRPANEKKEAVESRKTVTVIDSVDFDGQVSMKVSGVVEPHREIEIAAQVAGLIDQKMLECRAGTYVKADATLLHIDSSNYDLTYDRLAAEKSQAEASINELEQELRNLDLSLKLANKEFDLQKTDYQRKVKVGDALSASELDQAMRALTSAERSLTELRNTRRLAETRRTRLQTAVQLSDVRLKEAQLNKDRCIIKAPFDGVVVQDPVEKGDYVAAGKTVVIMEDIDKIDVKCNLRFEQLAKLVKYQVPDSRYLLDPTKAYELPPTPVRVKRTLPSGKKLEWDGMLVRYDGIGVDATTKMIPCRIVVDEPIKMQDGRPRALVRGMFVNVDIELDIRPDEDESIIELPEVAVHPGDRIWIVEDGKLGQRKVRIIERIYEDAPNPQDRLVVVSIKSDELSAGAKIVDSALSQPEVNAEVLTIPSDRNIEEIHSRMRPPASERGDEIQPSSTPAEDLDSRKAQSEPGVIRS